jgi:hypothetical protein
MRRGRLLRQRYRDESTVAALMDFRRARFVTLMVIVAVAALLIKVVIDVLLRTPNLLVTVLAPLTAVLLCGGLYLPPYPTKRSVDPEN